MFRIRSMKLIACCAALVFSLGERAAHAEVTERHEKVVNEVFQRLLAVMETPDGWEVWPPEVTVVDKGFANAFAGFRTEDGVDVPYVEITVTTVEEIADYDPDTLAFTLGHELGHLFFDHNHQSVEFREKFGDKLQTIRLACNREQELEADLFGMQLAFKAGYSRQGLIKDLHAWRENTTPYCRFEGLSVNHPTWEDRATFLFDDERQKSLWRSLSSFQTGVMFLENQHHLHAQVCFENVTVEFPECYEAWANLGYSLLMQYCDGLDAEDLKNFNIGHLVVGGFYRRPGSLEPTVRGVDPDLWFEAVGAFREALRLKERLGLKDDLLMVKANLAVAYLIHPAGKDVGQAEQWFDEVFTALRNNPEDSQLDPLVHASILINSGSARGFDSDLVVQTLGLLAEAKTKRGNDLVAEALETALQFNQARALTTSGDPANQLTALALFEKYLDGMTSASSWWPIAYEQYVQLSEAVGKAPKKESEFKQLGIKDWRPITAVELADGKTIGLSQPLNEVLKTLGPADVEIPVIEGKNIKYYKYEDLGITILATREVLAVILDSEKAPAVKIQRPGLGGDDATLEMGMNRGVLEGLLGSDWDVEITNLFQLDELHQLYRDLGLAVQFEDGVVSELVISVVPLK
ncbi:Peptidase family M48 [Thalassoglobus neptunius]|uniref:Peptidase family M48 n=1 Tax=Thalassoglobus neptunius TaxID=1938619 RepID=A0A5C5X5A7_9PLAN|nr:M48 family metalloprotease [Thalassoglobus neptunius]TWT57511.1 Peptidase family M48 [Thalassoglobus neptunius]